MKLPEKLIPPIDGTGHGSGTDSTYFITLTIAAEAGPYTVAMLIF